MSRRSGFLAAIVALVVLAATVAGSSLGGGKQQDAASAASGTVVLSGWGASSDELKLLKAVIRGFEKTYPKIKVDYQPITGDYPATMLAKFSARKPPDVFYVNSDAFLDWSPLAMEVNTALAAKAKVVPSRIQTWAQLTAAAKKLKPVMPSGAKPICLSANWDRLLAFVYQNKGSFLNKAKTKATVNSPAAKAAADYYVGLIRQDLADIPAKLGVDWCGAALGKEKAAIIFEGNWLFPFMQSTFPDVKFSTQRMLKNKTYGNLGFTASYSMARDSDNKDAAWQLIRYLVGRPGMKTWTSKGLALPSRKDVKPVAGRQPFLADAAYAHPWEFAPQFSKVMDTANNGLTAVIEGKESTSEMLKKVEDAANDALH